MADSLQIKQLKIKTGVVKRLIKEYQSYQKQVQKDQEKADKLNAEATNDDEKYVAKKAQDVVKETMTMVRDSQGRLSKAVADLQSLVSQFSEESFELKEANDYLLAASVAVSDNN